MTSIMSLCVSFFKGKRFYFPFNKQFLLEKRCKIKNIFQEHTFLFRSWFFIQAFLFNLPSEQRLLMEEQKIVRK